jgi:hypothetical protein
MIMLVQPQLRYYRHIRQLQTQQIVIRLRFTILIIRLIICIIKMWSLTTIIPHHL